MEEAKKDRKIPYYISTILQIPIYIIFHFIELRIIKVR